MLNGKTGRYAGPDMFAHVYAWAGTVEMAEAIARDANRYPETFRNKWVPGTFRVEFIPGHVPAVVGTLTGN